MKGKRRGFRTSESLFLELARRGEKVTGPMMRYAFRDGTVERVPLDLVKGIGGSQRGRLPGMLGGKLGGRPSDERPSADELFLVFGDHWLRSGRRYGIARRTFLEKLRKQYGISLKTARRWADGALGKHKK